MPTTLEQLAAGLMGADTQKEIASFNPYFDFAGVGSSIGDLALKAYAARKDATQNDLWQAAAVAGAGGLMSGLLKGFGNDYQDKLTNRYVNLAMGYQQPTTAEEAGLPQGLFGSAVRQSALFQRMQELQAAEDVKDVLKAKAVAQASTEGQMNAYLKDLADTNASNKATVVTPGVGVASLPGDKVLLADGGVATPGKTTVLGPNALKAALNPLVKEQVRLNERSQDSLDALRKEFNVLPEVKDFVTVERSAKILKEAVADPSSVADQELVRYSILLIEPGMAVREGEQKAVALSQSIPEAWKGYLDKALNGKAQLGPEIRSGLLRLAERSYAGHAEQYARALDNYTAIATGRGLDASLLSRIGTPISASEIFKNPVIAGKSTGIVGNETSLVPVDGGVAAQLRSLLVKARSGTPLTADEWAFVRANKK